MKTKEIIGRVIEELRTTAEKYDQNEIDRFISEINKAKRVFVCGAGRSLLVIRAFAMRLMHIGYTVYVVGETVTPAAEAGDLLVVMSGSGETGSLVKMAEKARCLGVSVALITTNEKSSIAKIASSVVKVSTSTSKLSDSNQEVKSIQPGGNTFEQSALLLFDSIIIELMSSKSLSENNSELMKRHANLE